MKKILGLIFRIDNLNRILVVISMALFLVYPSIILYHIDETNRAVNTIVPCLLIIATVVGAGSFSLVRPFRVPFFYFVEMLILLPVELYNFDPNGIDVNINMTAVIWLEAIYCLIAILINAVVFIRYWRRNSNAYLKEDTNGDTVYDFLNAVSPNKKIENDLEKITEEGDKNNLMKKRKEIVFSRALRCVSYGLIAIMLIVYILACVNDHIGLSASYFERLNLESLIIISLAFFFSMFFPRDFKYLYFYHTAVFLVFDMILAKNEGYKNVFYILAIVLLGVVFLLTLIVEGRTWMGADSE